MTTPNDALDFYPTPDSLAFDMVFSLREVKSGFTTYPKPILEPSAGDGALARQVHALAFNVHHDYKTGEVDQYDKGKARSAELDCIELSSDFRAVLKKDGFRVVHDNFLTFRPTTKYAAIVMNPPFSAGAAHLLKALDVMQDGGKIRCLLNAETLRNPCTNERKELAAKLEELHATVKYIPDAFKSARRAARVEVALVSVDIPDREPVSRIRLDLKNETAERLKENPEFAALVSSDPITAAIERYNAAAEGVRRIYEEYNGIKSLFSSAGAGKKENPVMAFTKSYNDAIRELRGMYWKQLFEMPQLFDAGKRDAALCILLFRGGVRQSPARRLQVPASQVRHGNGLVHRRRASRWGCSCSRRFYLLLPRGQSYRCPHETRFQSLPEWLHPGVKNLTSRNLTF